MSQPQREPELVTQVKGEPALMTQADDGPAPIAVLCAMEHELCHIRAVLNAEHEQWRAGRCAWPVLLDGHPVVLALCGIGMLSAAAVTEAVIAQYRPAAILNYGCAGAHRVDLLPGDLIIGARVVAYDSIRGDVDGNEQFAWMYYLRGGEQQKAEYLSADPGLLEAATRAAAVLEGRHAPWPRAAGWPPSIAHREPRLFIGTVASADRWNRAPQRIHLLSGLHDSLCEDMEAAAIALTCASHDVPFLTIKDISNNELLRTTGETFLTETQGQLGRRAAALMLETMRNVASARERVGG